jgi:hypothetical protein
MLIKSPNVFQKSPLTQIKAHPSRQKKLLLFANDQMLMARQLNNFLHPTRLTLLDSHLPNLELEPKKNQKTHEIFEQKSEQILKCSRPQQHSIGITHKNAIKRFRS